MKFTKHLSVLVSILLTTTMFLTACSSKPSAGTSSQTVKKTTLVGIAKSTDWKWADTFLKKVQDHFPQYNFVLKSFDGTNIDQTLKTMIAAGNAPDFSFYWPNYIGNYVKGNMATDLTPYLTANNNKWGNTFQNGTLDIGKVNGKVYDVPFESVYPMLIVNKDIMAKAVVTIPTGSWTWDEFITASKTIQEKLGGSGVFPLGLRTDWSCWPVRDGLLDNWATEQQSEDFAAGKISFLDPSVVKVFDESKSLYANNYAYPGKGAIAVKADEVLAGFKAGKVAMLADVNIMASADIKSTGVQNIQIASMPHSGPQDILLGGCDGWFIPSNATHKADAVKVLEYMTTKDCLQIVADSGSPVTIKGITSSDPNFAQYSKDTAKISRSEVVNVSAPLMDEITNKMPADYINNGITSLQNLEAMRKQALASK